MATALIQITHSYCNFSKTKSQIPITNMKEAQRAVARRFGGVVAGELDFTQLNTELALRQFGCEAVKSKRAGVALKRLAFWS
ncbi:MAG: hypothetical protein IT244_01105, partial [Bacteroidia bacterium]|nr:hypothetical protein [Bacteroidia bacterium]